MKKPIIGILGSILLMESGPFPGLDRTYVNHDYIRAVELAGGIPLLLPVLEDVSDVSGQLEMIDALVLSGGYDLHPGTYGEEPLQELGFVWPEMDRHQIAAAKSAAELGKPMLGICRGMQILNVAFGGSLYQDLNAQSDSAQQHVQKGRRHLGSHWVDVEAGSLLAEFVGEGRLYTNSFHHQAVKELASCFKVCARALDGMIEAFESHPEQGLVLGLQWHPEMMASNDAKMLKIFQDFINKAR